LVVNASAWTERYKAQSGPYTRWTVGQAPVPASRALDRGTLRARNPERLRAAVGRRRSSTEEVTVGWLVAERLGHAWDDIEGVVR
jgi:hypothetical protein